MSFLAPLAFWVAALVVPALLILYFLKLRRRPAQVPSTLLWKRAVRDLQVNAPFQKLRKNLLLFLQLLVLALAITALARPIVETSVSRETSVVLLIDRSASMNVLEGDRTRFELAKEQAVRYARTFNRTRGPWWSFFGDREAQARVMAIAFADRAEIISPFTANIGDVVDLIERLEPTDARTDVREALELAEAYMMQTTIEQNPESAQEASRIVLFSDGVVRGAEDTVLRSGALTLVPIGQARDNVGITSLNIQRNYERPEILTVLLQLENFGPGPVQTDVSLFIDGVLSRVSTVPLDAARERGTAPLESEEMEDATRPIASAALSFELQLDRGALLEARLSRDDALATDNRAYVVVPPPKRLRTLLVSERNFFLEAALQGLSLQRYDYLTPQQYENAPAEQIEQHGQSLYDVVIIDKYETARLPAGNYIFIGAVPGDEPELRVEERIGDHALQWWDETHPILRGVTLDYVFAAESLAVTAPPRAEKLIEGPRGPVLFRYSNEGRHYLILTFAVEASTWWGKISFPKFIQNAVLFMGGGGSIESRDTHRPGDVLRIPIPADEPNARIQRPDGRRDSLIADRRGYARYADTYRVGVYHVDPGVPDQNRFAVNLEDARESDIAPRTLFDIGGNATIEVGRAIRNATPEIWRWFVGAALALLFLEWYIYNRRVRM